MAWALATVIAWFAILFTGRHPRGLYDFGVGVLRWNTRVEAYLLLPRTSTAVLAGLNALVDGLLHAGLT